MHSELCFEHSNTPLFPVPPTEPVKPRGRRNPDAVFRKEVTRRRRERR